jgi:hypothetical protein
MACRTEPLGSERHGGGGPEGERTGIRESLRRFRQTDKTESEQVNSISSKRRSMRKSKGAGGAEKNLAAAVNNC